jgi:TP901 family phage tail tape measure protein
MALANRIIIALGLKMDQNSIRGVQARLTAMQANLAAVADRASRFGKSATAVGQTLTTRLSLPILALGAGVAKVSGDFEQAMNVLQGKTGATADEMAALRDRAKELGISTQFTAAQAADGMVKFAQAGFGANKILDSIGPALDFAVASQMDLGDVTRLTADVLAQFELSSKDTVRVADVLTKASDSATTTIEELGEAMTYAGAASNAVGASLEETAVIMAALANTGIKASMAGTSMRNAFIQLSKPSAEKDKAFRRLGLSVSNYVDKTGRLRVPFANLIKDLSNSGAGLKDLVEIFDVRAGAALAGIVKDFSKVEAAQEALSKSQGNAARQSAINMRGLNGAFRALVSALEGLGIAIGDSGLTAFLTESVKGLANLLRQVASINPYLLQLGTIIAGVAATVGPLALGVGALSKAFAVLARSSTVAWLATLWPAVALVGVLAAVYLIIEDVVAFLDGRPSLIGYLLEDPDNLMPRFWDWLQMVGRYLKDEAGNAAQSFGELLAEALDNDIRRLKAVYEWMQKIANFLPGSGRVIESWASLFRGSPDAPVAPMVPSLADAHTRVASTGISRFSGPTGRQEFRQLIAPNISVTITTPGSTADDIIEVLRRETSAMFGEVARQNITPLAQ